MHCKVAVQRFEIGVCALAGHESQLHQLARCVIDEDQQRAGLAALLEPAMIATIDLDQFAVALAPQSRLVECSSLRTRQPQALRHHPASQRLSAYSKLMLVQQHFGRQRRPKVGVLALDQLDGIFPDAFVPAPIRRPASSLMNQPATAITLVPG
jgi:hypothetical protein